MFPGGFVAQEPFELVVIDVVTKLPSSDGNTLLLTVVDVFTKLALAIPIPNDKSETVAKALQQRLFSVYGYPRLLLSDRANGFVSDGLKWLCKHMGIVKVNTTGLLPTGASPVERYHRSLSASLTMVCNQAKSDWSFLVDSVVFAYNISVNETTGFSPFYLTTGRHPHLPLEVLTGLKLSSVKHKDHAFVEKMSSALNEAFKIVRERQLKTLNRNQRVQLGLRSGASDKEVEIALADRPVPGFKLGHLVNLWVPQVPDRAIAHTMPQKLQYRWSGPHCVLDKEGSHYKIDRNGKDMLVNPNRLRMYHEWLHEAWAHEDEGDLDQSKIIDDGEPEVGDLITVSLEVSRKSRRAFAIGQILEIRADDEYWVHWWGNSETAMEGTYRPEWRTPIGENDIQVHYSEKKGDERGTVPFTSDDHEFVVRRRHIQHFGFNTLFNDRLPVELKRKMHKNPMIQWYMPGKKKNQASL
jgi:hypothetical protein